MVRKKETFTDDEDEEAGNGGIKEPEIKGTEKVEFDPSIESRKRAHQEKIRR